MSKWKVIRAVLLLPFMVIVVIPGVVLHQTQGFHVGWTCPLRLVPILLGLCLMGLGLSLVTGTATLFYRRGQGSLAPWDPPKRLVVEGVYCHVRNPMISGVFFALLGQAALWGSRPLLCWSLLFLLVNALYIPLIEEPGLTRRFGEDYLRYRAAVPRWVPRLQPWKLESP